MHEGKLVFSQLTDYLPLHTFRVSNIKTIPLSGDGICSLSRRTPRYRSLPSCTTKQTLSYGNSNKGIQEYTGRCQRTTRLEDLRRLRPGTDQNCAASICKRRSWARSRQYRLRSRCLNYRSLPFRISLGAVPSNQVSRQTPYITGFKREYSDLYSYLRRQATRRQCARHSHNRTRGWIGDM